MNPTEAIEKSTTNHKNTLQQLADSDWITYETASTCLAELMSDCVGLWAATCLSKGFGYDDLTRVIMVNLIATIRATSNLAAEEGHERDLAVEMASKILSRIVEEKPQNEYNS